MKTLLCIGKTYRCPRCGSRYLAERSEGGSYTRPLDEKERCGFWCDVSFRAWRHECEGCHSYVDRVISIDVGEITERVLNFCGSCEEMHYRMEGFAEALREQRVERGA